MLFVDRIIAWQRQHGRHDLPWQNTGDPYRVWLSEIMLQQTQVATVLGYFDRFVVRFPDIQSLAAASQDEVMPYWAGLGYYARARNLHRCAQVVVRDWAGRFPPTAESIATLPGIGPSTAAAIAAFSYGEPSPILDGNVKRVFARHFGVHGDPARKDIEREMWAIAHREVQAAQPGVADMPAYTQGLMDLGATLCTRRQPACMRCPVQTTCVAARDSLQDVLPTPRVRKAQARRATAMLVMVKGDQLLLTQRPQTGIWGGLWSLPECAPEDDLSAAIHACGVQGEPPLAMAAFEHVFTHFRLTIQPWYVRVIDSVPPSAPLRWFGRAALADLGLPAPVRKLVDGLMAQDLAWDDAD